MTAELGHSSYSACQMGLIVSHWSTARAPEKAAPSARRSRRAAKRATAARSCARSRATWRHPASAAPSALTRRRLSASRSSCRRRLPAAARTAHAEKHRCSTPASQRWLAFSSNATSSLCGQIGNSWSYLALAIGCMDPTTIAFTGLLWPRAHGRPQRQPRQENDIGGCSKANRMCHVLALPERAPGLGNGLHPGVVTALLQPTAPPLLELLSHAPSPAGVGRPGTPLRQRGPQPAPTHTHPRESEPSSEAAGFELVRSASLPPQSSMPVTNKGRSHKHSVKRYSKFKVWDPQEGKHNQLLE
jgi:hypothetical protein